VIIRTRQCRVPTAPRIRKDTALHRASAPHIRTAHPHRTSASTAHPQGHGIAPHRTVHLQVIIGTRQCRVPTAPRIRKHRASASTAHPQAPRIRKDMALHRTAPHTCRDTALPCPRFLVPVPGFLSFIEVWEDGEVRNRVSCPKSR
jgi:hypothetical protein